MALVSAFRLSHLTLQNQAKIVNSKNFSALSQLQQFNYGPRKNYDRYYQQQKREKMGFGKETGQGGSVSWSTSKMVVFCIGTGSVLAIGKREYDQYKREKVQKKLMSPIGQEVDSNSYEITDEIPEFPVARSIRNPNDNTKIKFTLYQYQTCPFCCKARAFLDYYGVSYDVIEVNSVTRKQVRVLLSRMNVLLLWRGLNFEGMCGPSYGCSGITYLSNCRLCY